jgi:hypothetical protein
MWCPTELWQLKEMGAENTATALQPARVPRTVQGNSNSQKKGVRVENQPEHKRLIFRARLSLEPKILRTIYS